MRKHLRRYSPIRSVCPVSESNLHNAGEQPPLVLRPEDLRARLRQVPTHPGVYIMKDAADTVLYVGKARNARQRLRSYFAPSAKHGLRIAQLVSQIVNFDIVPCTNESEALVLENLLIKEYSPKFNVRLKDDKSYLFLKLPRPVQHREIQEDPTVARTYPDAFPRPVYTRKAVHDGSQYFGPYPDSGALRSTIRYVRPTFNFRTCSDDVFRQGRVCLDYHIKRCQGPCAGLIAQDSYASSLEDLGSFLSGRVHPILRKLRHQMEEESARLHFERAAVLRDRIDRIVRLQQRQHVITVHRGDHDCIGIARTSAACVVAVMNVRDGAVAGVEWFDMTDDADWSDADVVRSFIGQHYEGIVEIPRYIMIPFAIEDPDELDSALSSYAGHKVRIHVPVRGQFRELSEKVMEMAHVAISQRVLTPPKRGTERIEEALVRLQHTLHVPTPLHRIECYDISNTMGTNSVGSMVVFIDGKAVHSLYRIFSIKTVEGPNDFASHQEVMERRLRHLPEKREEESLPLEDPEGSNGDRGEKQENMQSHKSHGYDEGGEDDESLREWPDLIIIDGGKGQLSAVMAVVRASGRQLPVVGLAKRFEEIFLPNESKPVILPRDSEELFLVQRLRDEAHRFAITRHRAKRAKASVRSVLDDVNGIGPTRKKRLISQYGTIDRMRTATAEELADVLGCSLSTAQSIKEQL